MTNVTILGRLALVALLGAAVQACGPSEEEQRRAQWERVAAHFGPRIEALREGDREMRQASATIESASGERRYGQIIEGTMRARHACATNREQVAALMTGPTGELDDVLVSSSVLLVTSAASSFNAEMELYCDVGFDGLLRDADSCDRSCITWWTQLRESLDGMAESASTEGVTIPRLDGG